MGEKDGGGGKEKKGKINGSSLRFSSLPSGFKAKSYKTLVVLQVKAWTAMEYSVW